jgi:beta-glucosidase
MLKFPNNFLWGAATSAYQVEGDNSNADWWAWEKSAAKEPSAKACRHYEFYEQDFDLAKELNHNAHRLSIEWARIEPQEGQFSEKEIKHYLDVVLALRHRGITPVVTLHHFTNPLWFSQSGGWESERSAELFARYAEFVTKTLAPHVRTWIAINEPTVLISHAYLLGVWPPQAKKLLRARKAHDNLIQAHIGAYRKIHHIYKAAGLADPSVGIAQHMTAVVPCSSTLRNRLAAGLRDYWYNFEILDQLARHRTLDFIGVNYYTRHLVHVTRWGLGDLLGEVCAQGHHALKKNSLGWDIYPEGLGEVLMKLKRYNLPVMITENGICTEDDGQRWEFIAEHLRHVHGAIQQGVPVIGYLYWSLMDNFEWDKGFAPRFGLLHVDYQTYQRTIKESARKFAQVCRTGEIE